MSPQYFVRKPARLWMAVFLVIGLSTAQADNQIDKPGGELKHGRYVGWLQLDKVQARIALVADFHVESPEDFTKFPELNATVKMTLGGYNTHEYVTEKFHKLLYDFDNGVLTFNEPQNDLVMTTEVHNVGSSTLIIGDVFVRSSATTGKVYLKFLTDEPGEGEPGEPGATPGPFLPLLQGQYEGTCEGKRAMLQLQTVRGLKTSNQAEKESNGLGRHYGISGRISYANSAMCGEPTPNRWCTHFNFGGGAYNFFLGKLALHGRHSSESCEVGQGRVQCQIRIQGKSIACDFKKPASNSMEPKFHDARTLVRPTAEQMGELPPPAPPKSVELSKALRGNFTGYLHNETNNTYHLMSLNVTPFAFTANPHNPNQLMVSTTASFYLGRQPSDNFITQRYEPRSFYIRPGFTLSSPNTDSYISITGWRRGYITGVLYSKAFGRVGTVQLVKGEFGQIPANIEIIRSFTGEFEGPMAKDGTVTRMRWLRFLFPTQPNDLTDHLIRFSGSQQAVVGITAIQNIDKGTFDPYTGALGWVLSHQEAATLSNGYMDSNDNLKLFWPPAPSVFGALNSDFQFETFKRR